MIMTSPGQLANELARFIYKNQRNIVDALVKGGKIIAKNAAKEWARRVAVEFGKYGLKVSKNIMKLL